VGDCNFLELASLLLVAQATRSRRDTSATRTSFILPLSVVSLQQEGWGGTATKVVTTVPPVKQTEDICAARVVEAPAERAAARTLREHNALDVR
jgi:hypothetical protein